MHIVFTKKENGEKMNNQDLEILKCIEKNSNLSQRSLSEITGYSLGRINKSIKELFENKYINKNAELTEKGKELFNENKPHNAIILAAGFGMRMVPINTEIPKGLLEVKGEALIEHTIEQLKAVGINKIIVVVGYLKESYEYLIDKYGIQLRVNMEYSSKNNLHSLAIVSEEIGNTYIIPCDVYCRENPFSKKEIYSWYMVTDENNASSDVRVNRKKELVHIKKDESGNNMLGIAYINKEDSKNLIKRLKDYSHNDSYKNSFWEETLYINNKMITVAKVVSSNGNYEINTLEQLRNIDQNSSNLKSKIISLIANVFNTKENLIKNITVLKKGMTNRSFKFEFGNEQYIMRIPGQGTDELIDRRNEYNVYQKIKDIEISDKIYYINPDNGYKITKYINNATCCDDSDWEDVKKCMIALKNFHNKHLSVEHTFDLFKQIDFYESLWDEKSCYKDYRQTKQKVFKLKKFVDLQKKVWTLSHIDANADNFLIWVDDNGIERVSIIDWEYAAMQDAHLDIAMFAIYSMYDKKDIDRLIDCYFENQCSMQVRLKIYAYIAIAGLLWSNWCEYKRQKGQEFGEYSLRQYRYAKEYSKIVLEKLDEEN